MDYHFVSTISTDQRPQQLAIRFASDQQATDELGCNDLGWAGEEGLGEVLGEVGGYGSGLV